MSKKSRRNKKSNNGNSDLKDILSDSKIISSEISKLDPKTLKMLQDIIDKQAVVAVNYTSKPESEKESVDRVSADHPDKIIASDDSKKIVDTKVKESTPEVNKDDITINIDKSNVKTVGGESKQDANPKKDNPVMLVNNASRIVNTVNEQQIAPITIDSQLDKGRPVDSIPMSIDATDVSGPHVDIFKYLSSPINNIALPDTFLSLIKFSNQVPNMYIITDKTRTTLQPFVSTKYKISPFKDMHEFQINFFNLAKQILFDYAIILHDLKYIKVDLGAKRRTDVENPGFDFKKLMDDVEGMNEADTLIISQKHYALEGVKPVMEFVDVKDPSSTLKLINQREVDIFTDPLYQKIKTYIDANVIKGSYLIDIDQLRNLFSSFNMIRRILKPLPPEFDKRMHLMVLDQSFKSLKYFLDSSKYLRLMINDICQVMLRDLIIIPATKTQGVAQQYLRIMEARTTVYNVTTQIPSQLNQEHAMSFVYNILLATLNSKYTYLQYEVPEAFNITVILDIIIIFVTIPLYLFDRTSILHMSNYLAKYFLNNLFKHKLVGSISMMTENYLVSK